MGGGADGRQPPARRCTTDVTRTAHDLAPRTVEVDVLLDGRGVLEILGAPYHGDVIRRAEDTLRRSDLEADGYAVAELWASELAD